MKRKTFLLILFFLGVVIAATFLLRQGPVSSNSPKPKALAQQTVPAEQGGPPLVAQIPAHYATAPAIDSLAPILPPEKFSGKAREAYQAVKEIPQIIAQLPCYCHCDRSLGHKSLHSCFENDHAASCATCIGEALMAYQLQKQGIPAARIREQIVAQYSQ